MPGIVNGKPVVPKIFMAVLYDPGTGQIAHYHRVLQFDPKQKVSKARVEERAKELATRHGWDISKLKILHVDHSKLKQGGRYKVDHKSRALVELPARPMPQSQSPLRRRA
jgi:hypothetical protein